MNDGPIDDPYSLTDEAIQPPPKSLLAALAKIGPGIVLAGSIVGSGELILTTSLGADWGFVFLWLILFSCVIKVFVQIELGRYAISSGQPTLTALNSLPVRGWARTGWCGGGSSCCWRACFNSGRWWASWAGFAHGVSGVSPGIANAVGSIFRRLAESLRQRPEHPWSIATALAAVLLLLSGGYKRLEWVTTVLVAGVTLVTVTYRRDARRHQRSVRLADIQKGFSMPSSICRRLRSLPRLPPSASPAWGRANSMPIPIGAWKKATPARRAAARDDPAWAERARGWLRVMTLDAWVSMLVFTVATVAFYFLGAAVLHRHNLHPKGPQMIVTLAEMYVPTFGDWTKIIFMIGAWAVLFKTLYVASAGHARLSADFLSLARIVKYDQPGLRHRWIQRFCIFFPALALVLYLSFREPKMMVTIGGYAQAVTIPVIAGAALYLRYFRTDRRLAPSWFSDVWLWVAFVLITAVAIYAVVNDVLPTVSKWLAISS